MSRPRFLAALMLCVLTWLPPLCAAADDEVVIHLKWLHQFQFAGLYAALEQGYFADEGLKVSLRERDPERNVVTQVIEGDADYGISDSILLLHHARGDPVVIVSAIMQHSANAIMTMADSALALPQDLVGRRLAFYENDSDGIDLIALLADHGMQTQGMTRRGWDERISALITGDVDAISIYITNEPFVLREMGYKVNIISPRNYGFDLYGDLLFTSRKEAETRPERVAAMRRAILRGWTHALDHKAEMVELIHERYNTQGKSRATLMDEALGMEALISRHTTELGSLDSGRIEFIIKQLQRQDLMGARHRNHAQLLFTGGDSAEPLLTTEEREFLDALGPIRFPIEDAGWAPFEFFDDNGAFSGIAADYLDALAEILGIEFELVRGLNWTAILEAARNREVDLLPVAASTADRREYMLFTKPYVRSPMVIATRDDVDYIAELEQLRDHSIGVVGEYASDELLSRYYPDLRLRRHPNTIAGLRAVASGSDFAFVDNLAATIQIIKSEGLANLKISGQTPYSFDLSIGVRSDWPLLHSAIEKALASISPQRQDEIYDRWVHTTVAEAFPWKRVLPGALGAAFIIVLLLSYTLRLRSFNRRLARTEQALQDRNRLLHVVSVTDKLTHAFNRHQLDMVLTEQFERARRHERPLSLVIFDLDHFKQVNDNFGHQVGDEVLRRFADITRSCTRISDVFGRWGGEEFLLICPETSVDQAAIVADKIRRTFAAEHFEQGVRPTVSAGVVDNRDVLNTDQFISSADHHLYAAKLAGRNRVVKPQADDATAAPRDNFTSR